MHAPRYMPSPVMNITDLPQEQSEADWWRLKCNGFITRLSNSLWYNAVYCRICTKFSLNKTLPKKMALLEPEHHNCYITHITKWSYLYVFTSNVTDYSSNIVNTLNFIKWAQQFIFFPQRHWPGSGRTLGEPPPPHPRAPTPWEEHCRPGDYQGALLAT